MNTVCSTSTATASRTATSSLRVSNVCLTCAAQVQRQLYVQLRPPYVRRHLERQQQAGLENIIHVGNFYLRKKLLFT